MGSSGERPPALRISKQSQRIRKPPPLKLPINTQSRLQPTIIHIYSPKVIRTHPNNFMSLVQRLTGKSAIETGLNIHPNDTPVTARTDLFPASMSNKDTDPPDNVQLEVFISPRSSVLRQVKAHDQAQLLHQGEDESTFSLTPAPNLSFLPSPAANSSYSALRSAAPLWSPIFTPSFLAHPFLAEFSCLSPGEQRSCDKSDITISTDHCSSFTHSSTVTSTVTSDSKHFV